MILFSNLLSEDEVVSLLLLLELSALYYPQVGRMDEYALFMLLCHVSLSDHCTAHMANDYIKYICYSRVSNDDTNHQDR